jgi:NAD dependent epimerase/dehydratase family enzyme
VLGLPWTAARRRELIQSRTRIAEDLQALVSRLERRPPVWVSASAVGYYGVPKAGVICDEGSPAMPGVFQSDLCAAAEHEARRAEGLGLRVVRVRLGVVLGRGDGAYPMQALAARLGLGACLGSGTQALPWVHVDDAVGLLHWAAKGCPQCGGPGNLQSALLRADAGSQLGPAGLAERAGLALAPAGR